MKNISNYFVGICFSIILFSGMSNGYSQTSKTYIAVLNGSNVLPPVNTNASGIAEISIVQSMDRWMAYLYYDITLRNTSGINAIELHNAPNDLNGTVVSSAFEIPEIEDESISSINGTILPFYFESSLGGKEKYYLLDDALVRELDDKYMYIDIHTEEYPEGEIRGQFFKK